MQASTSNLPQPVNPWNIVRAIALAILVAIAAWNLLDFLLSLWWPELRALVWSMAQKLRH